MGILPKGGFKINFRSKKKEESTNLRRIFIKPFLELNCVMAGSQISREGPAYIVIIIFNIHNTELTFPLAPLYQGDS